MKGQHIDAEKLLGSIKPRNAYDHYYFMYAMKVKSALGKHSEAIHFINAGMRVSDKPENIAALHFWKADSYGKLGFLDSFIVNLDKAISLDSTKYEYYMSRIHYYSVVKLPDMELQDIYRLFRLDSSEVDFYSTLALYHLEKTDTTSAINIYKDMLKKQPENFAALKSMGLINYSRRKYGQAIKYFEKAININPTDGELFMFTASALGYDRNGDKDKACEYLLKAANFGNEEAYKHLYKCDEYYKKRGIEMKIHYPTEKEKTNNKNNTSTDL